MPHAFVFVMGLGIGMTIGHFVTIRGVRGSQPQKRHITSRVQCYICTYEWQAVYEEGTDAHRLECKMCGSQESILI